jgi:hypothetical protein
MVYALPSFPRMWFLRRFDSFGVSHQVVHVMAVVAALSYTLAMLVDYQHRDWGSFRVRVGTAYPDRWIGLEYGHSQNERIRLIN